MVLQLDQDRQQSYTTEPKATHQLIFVSLRGRYFRIVGNIFIWERSDDLAESRALSIYNSNTFLYITYVYRLQYKDGSSVIVSYAQAGKFADERIRCQVATMRYIAAKTTIPVPKIYYCGGVAENPVSTGSFIMTDYIEHERTMSDIANIFLQLSTLKFPRTGSLDGGGDKDISVSARLHTRNMDSLRHAEAVLVLVRPHDTSGEFYSALADIHLGELIFRHGRTDTPIFEDDMRDIYVARQLFRQLASERKLTSRLELTRALRMKEEYIYATPAQFSFDPPWWLLLKTPENWPGGIKVWTEAYKPRLDTFIRALEGEESQARVSSGITGNIGTPSLSDDLEPSLSQRMRNSWENKAWMINYAARNSKAFDYLFWKFLDTRFFGHSEAGDHYERIKLLSQHEIELLELFISVKIGVTIGEETMSSRFRRIFIRRLGL
ncbi:phosphotransferase family protein [Hypomontagnella monticulosa]|nr:phosphotransferase family protein [Hypomontagnella monticulosa]